MSKIKAIVFDIGGVLDKGTWQEHYIPLCKELNVDMDKFDVPFKKHFKDYSAGKISTEEFMGLIAKEIKVDPKELLDKWITIKNTSLTENHDVRETIIKLKGKNYRVVALTNINPLHHKLRIEKNLYDLFEFSICSCEVGICKPDMEIYKLLLEKLKGIPQEQMIFIDDNEDCLVPARKLGINTILFKNPKQLEKDLRKLGVKI